MNNRQSRTLPVPEGLAGMRVDAALSKLLGISRTVAAELATAFGLESALDRPVTANHSPPPAMSALMGQW